MTFSKRFAFFLLVLGIIICVVSAENEKPERQHNKHSKPSLSNVSLSGSVPVNKNNRKGHQQKQQQQQPQCRKHCPLKQRWICGFDGSSTYRFFANKCWMDKFNCAGKANGNLTAEFNHVDRKLCQKAHNELHRQQAAASHHNHHQEKDKDGKKVENKCIKCNGGYKPVCGYNGEVNQMFKNMCHLKRFNCIHTEKEYQATQLNNCPIPVPAIKNKGESKRGKKVIEGNEKNNDKALERTE